MLPKYAYVGIGIGGVLAIVLVVLSFGPKPVIDVQVVHGESPVSSGSIKWTRLVITNNSGMPLNGVVIDMGREIQTINKIKTGETVWLSPSSDVTTVAIGTNEGISVRKTFELHPDFAT